LKEERGGKGGDRGEKGTVAYNGEGHDKRPKGSHGVGSNGVQHAHVVLRVLCLDRIGLVIGDVGFLVQVVGMFLLGESLLGLDLWGTAI